MQNETAVSKQNPEVRTRQATLERIEAEYSELSQEELLEEALKTKAEFLDARTKLRDLEKLVDQGAWGSQIFYTGRNAKVTLAHARTIMRYLFLRQKAKDQSKRANKDSRTYPYNLKVDAVQASEWFETCQKTAQRELRKMETMGMLEFEGEGKRRQRICYFGKRASYGKGYIDSWLFSLTSNVKTKRFYQRELRKFDK